MPSKVCYGSKICRSCHGKIETDEIYRTLKKGSKHKRYVHEQCYIDRREVRADRLSWIKILRKAVFCEQLAEKTRREELVCKIKR